MKEKKTVLHVIDTLIRGGAETLLTGYVKEMPEFHHVLVYLNERNDFDQDLEGVNLIRLGITNKLLWPVYALKLQKIIRDKKVCVIHSHLFWSTILVRMANLNQLPHFFSIHNKINQTVFLKHPYTKILEKLTYNKRQIGIAVSGAVRVDYVDAIKPQGEVKVLYNYIEDKFYINRKQLLPFDAKKGLKLVAVGNLKEQKNYPFLIRAFSLLKELPVSLDIYGSGPLYDDLVSLINELQVSNKVTLKGTVSNIDEILPTYDAFVMASIVEGFGLAPVEAMAKGLPLLLSDINVLKEVASDYAFYFNPYEEGGFVKLITAILTGKVDLNTHQAAGMCYAETFNKSKYLNDLTNLYKGVLNS